MLDIKTGNAEDMQTIANFQVLMAMETENFKLDLETVKKGITYFFQNPAMGKYLIVKEGKETVGCMLIQYEWSDWRNAKVIWLHSVYVVPEYRKKGAFKMLYEHVENMVKESEEFTGIRLFVDKTNTKAQQVYKKMGMTSEHYELFEWLK